MLARAAQTRLPELLAMLEDREMLLMHRLVVSEAISQLARQQPALRPTIVAFLQRHLRHIIEHADQASQLFPPDTDSYGYGLEDYLAGVLADMQEAGLREPESEMREPHGLGLVDESIAGGANDIEFDREDRLLPLPDIFARYQLLRDEPDNFSPFHPDAAAGAGRTGPSRRPVTSGSGARRCSSPGWCCPKSAATTPARAAVVRSIAGRSG